MALPTSIAPVSPASVAPAADGRSTPTRRVIGPLRLAMGLVLLAAVGTQIIDEAVHDAFVPAEYFSYFTIQSALMAAVVLILAGLSALRQRADSEAFTSVRLMIFAYMIITGAVYAALLRGIPTDGYPGITWPNEALHVWAPIFIALDWLLAPGRARLTWKPLRLAIVFPVLWLGYTLIRGAITGSYPYPFLDPAQPDGWTGVVLYIVGIAAVILALTAVGIASTRLNRGRRAEPSTGMPSTTAA